MNSKRNQVRKVNHKQEKKEEVMKCLMINQEGIKRKEVKRAAQKGRVKEGMKQSTNDLT